MRTSFFFIFILQNNQYDFIQNYSYRNFKGNRSISINSYSILFNFPNSVCDYLSFGGINSNINRQPNNRFFKKQIKIQKHISYYHHINNLHLNRRGIYNDVYPINNVARAKFIAFKYC